MQNTTLAKSALNSLKNATGSLFIRQGTKHHPHHFPGVLPPPSIDLEKPTSSSMVDVDLVDDDDDTLETEETEEQDSIEEQDTPSLALTPNQMEVALYSEVEQWVVQEAPLKFDSLCADWLEEFGPELLAANISKRLVAEKSKSRIQSRASKSATPTKRSRVDGGATSSAFVPPRPVKKSRTQ